MRSIFSFSSPPLDIFIRNHFLIMPSTYPEPEERAGAVRRRPEPEFLCVPFFCRIYTLLGSELSEDPDSAL